MDLESKKLNWLHTKISVLKAAWLVGILVQVDGIQLGGESVQLYDHKNWSGL